ncbi:hypothetical protein P8Q88_04530 [Qipengyuania sp. XHP0207]|uniref:hypothetical protein n=1 Tax=Qipengyuania sp. XHP0207 TaxID=3038078 RepID=UPI00241DDF25|nr:hypothetical protein [Qipengyuania sp. XHP0207]MDG5747438.1 hypothetical protein [Qipengyuania sp. XHP0207]
MSEGKYRREPKTFERVLAGILVAASIAVFANLLTDGSLLGIDGMRGIAFVGIPTMGFFFYAKSRRIGFHRDDRA